MAKVSALIRRLQKIQEKHGDLDIGIAHLSKLHNDKPYLRKAFGVDLKVRQPKTNPVLLVEPW